MFDNREGTRIPAVTLRIRSEGRWQDLNTEAFFAGKTVVVFSLPGAFTPTCSSSHVPRYNELADAFARAGVDEIVCVSVNDAFVMDAWKVEQKADRVFFFPDGNGLFTKGMGMLVDKRDLGFGERSWRYAMVVKDGVIQKMFVEEERPGDPYDVSDADTVLRWLGGTASPDIAMVARPGCAFCADAKKMLAEAGLPYAELPSSPRTLRALPGGRTTPQIWIDGVYIGGSTELKTWLQAR